MASHESKISPKKATNDQTSSWSAILFSVSLFSLSDRKQTKTVAVTARFARCALQATHSKIEPFPSHPLRN